MDAFLQRLRWPEGCPDPLEPELLERLVCHIVASVSVNPGMEVVMRNSFSPALWQPIYIVCIGNDQVCVVTLAFIGDPVMGDRPSSKSTPFILRLVTDDLAAAVLGHTRGTSQYSIQPAPLSVATIALHVTELADEFFVAKATGNRVSRKRLPRTYPLFLGVHLGHTRCGCRPVRLKRCLSQSMHGCVNVLNDGVSVSRRPECEGADRCSKPKWKSGFPQQGCRGHARWSWDLFIFGNSYAGSVMRDQRDAAARM